MFTYLKVVTKHWDDALSKPCQACCGELVPKSWYNQVCQSRTAKIFGFFRGGLCECCHGEQRAQRPGHLVPALRIRSEARRRDAYADWLGRCDAQGDPTWRGWNWNWGNRGRIVARSQLENCPVWFRCLGCHTFKPFVWLVHPNVCFSLFFCFCWDLFRRRLNKHFPGKHWKLPSLTSMYEIQKNCAYDLSFQAITLHHFLSHDWQLGLLTLLAFKMTLHEYSFMRLFLGVSVGKVVSCKPALQFKFKYIANLDSI